MKKQHNYLMESVTKTKALAFTMIWIITTLLAASLDVVQLRIATDIISSNDITKVNILIICSITIMILSGTGELCDRGVDYSFVYLVNIFSEKILTSDYAMFIKWSPSEIMTTGNSIYQFSSIIRQSKNIAKSIVLITINTVAIILIDYTVALPIALFYIVGGLVLRVINKKWIENDKKFDKAKRARNAELDDILNGFAEVRAYQNENKHIKSIREQNKNSMSLLFNRKKISSIMYILFEIFSSFTTIIVVLYSVLILQDKGVSVAKTLNILVFASRLLGPLDMLIDCSSGFSELMATYPRFEEIMNYENEVSDGEIKLSSFEDSIEFRDVSFSYDKSRKIITNLNLVIKKGQKIGICGPTGGGKSTLLKLIPKYYDPDSGLILIDGLSSKDYCTESIRNKIGIIHQDPYIFNDSIKNNLLYAKKDATYDELVSVCKKASIYDFILSLEDKFDTQVGPRGLKLSGGQKQRLALAKLLLKNPDIVILDEATSALDNETEKIIQESLSMFKNKTQIVVAHRLSTIKDSDKIVVIDNHKVIEEGTHSELLKMNGIYSKLYKSAE